HRPAPRRAGAGAGTRRLRPDPGGGRRDARAAQALRLPVRPRPRLHHVLRGLSGAQRRGTGPQQPACAVPADRPHPATGTRLAGHQRSGTDVTLQSRYSPGWWAAPVAALVVASVAVDEGREGRLTRLRRAPARCRNASGSTVRPRGLDRPASACPVAARRTV